MSCRSLVVLVFVATVSLPGARAAELPVARDPLANNAALAYWQAFILMPKPDEGKPIDVDDPIDARVIEFVESGDVAMHQLHRAAGMDRCVWGAELEAGIEAQMPHLSQARKMARFASLRARVRFSQDRPAEAIRDLTAVMAMGRHAGSDGLLISLLVQYAIERMAFETLAENLPSILPEQLDEFSRLIEGLPECKTMSHAMQMEMVFFLEWFIDRASQPGGMEELFAMIEEQLADLDKEERAKYKTMSRQEIVDGLIELRAIYNKLSEILKRPPDEVDEFAENLIEKLKLSGPAELFASFILPAVGKMRRSEATHQTQQVMLKAAMAVVKDGRSQLQRKELQGPYDKGPFEYATTKEGFTLKSKLLDRQGKVVVLSVGPVLDE